MKFRKNLDKEIEPDEIFLDSSNLSLLNTQQFEGWLERPISKRIVVFTLLFFITVSSIFLWKLWYIQINMGERFAKRSEVNNLKKINYPPERGIIYDRNGKILAWNEEGGRVYSKISGLYNVLGYLGYPSEEDVSSGFLGNPKELIGKEGVEKVFNQFLRGKDGTKIIEVDVFGNIQSESVFDPGIRGGDIYLSIDSELSDYAYELVKNLAENKKFSGGSLIVMDVSSGEIVAMASYPEYNSNDLMSKNQVKVASYLDDKRMPFLNRTISGLYVPGSVLKPIFALGALNEGIIKPEKKIYSAGFISIPNPYFPDKPSIFKDWKAHGWMDMRNALAFSSDVYFYAIGGGYEDQEGLGIDNLEKYSRLFGIGTTTGIELLSEGIGNIPSPSWKELTFGGEKWTLGNTYHSAIGQYGFQVTPIQMVRAISAIANGGKLIKPTVLRSNKNSKEPEILAPFSVIDISEENFKIIREGMRLSVTKGTSIGLNIPQVEIAGKTGTAELGVSKNYVNSWNVGFFPCQNPKYAFAVVMEKGPKENTIGGAYIMRGLFDWMAQNKPEYIL